MSWYKESIKNSLIDRIAAEHGYTIDAYHGTSNFIEFKFNKEMSAQGVFWFSESKRKIESGESGASGFSDIMHVKLMANKTAGWDEYEKYGLGQIEDMGFDSIKLDDDWIIFNSNQIKLANDKTYDDEGRLIPLEKRFNPFSSDIRY